MISELLEKVRNRVAMIRALDGAAFAIAPNARFDLLVEGKINVVVFPASVVYEETTRDVVKEITTVAVAVAVYFADKFSEYDLLEIVPQIEHALLQFDPDVSDGLYLWESAQALGQPMNSAIKDTPGGLLDVGAADQEYVYQVPVYVSFARYFKKNAATDITLYSGEAPEPATILADESLRLRLHIVDHGHDVTAKMKMKGTLSFV